MNCTVLQRRLLAMERPDQPPAELQSHLAECAACRAWQHRLVRMEHLLPLLPVPPSSAKGQFLQRISGHVADKETRRQGDKESAVSLSPGLLVSLSPPLVPGPKERGRRKLSLALALAASLLVFAMSWWTWPHTTQLPSRGKVAQVDPFVRDFEGRLLGILRGDAPRERVRKLADLAEEVHGQAQQATDNIDKLDRLVEFYSRVVSLHLLEQAHQLPRADRPAVLEDIATRLRQAESNASRWASRLKRSAPRSAASFDRIAFAARKGEQDLRILMRA